MSHYTGPRQYLEFKKWHERFHDLWKWNAFVAYREMMRAPYKLL